MERQTVLSNIAMWCMVCADALTAVWVISTARKIHKAGERTQRGLTCLRRIRTIQVIAWVRELRAGIENCSGAVDDRCASGDR
jgi:hypothetical protein